MRGLIALLALAACSGAPRVEDASVRRAVLEASLVSKTNNYARLRLAHYATGTSGDWDRLDAWNPATEPVLASDLDAAGGASEAVGPNARALVLTQDLRKLGEEAFFRYPVQDAPAAVALRSRFAAKAYGLWIDETVGGIVRTSERGFAYTCSTCHATNRTTPGISNASLDVGGMMIDTHHPDAEHTAALDAWGPGRLDVTTYDGSEPVRIPDLRPTRFQTHLHATASVKLESVQSLAIRLETLIIVSNAASFRPPREVALGLATYLFSLGDTIPLRTDPLTESETRGKTSFEQRCNGCHTAPNFTGKPVALETIGTDPRVGQSLDRGTGTYRVPSLRGVNTRTPLLHDGSASSLEMLFDPKRTESGFAGRLGAPIQGHAFGLDLDAAARADLIAYLRTL